MIAELAPDAVGVVGMSLGGLSSIALAARAPELVRALVLVDVTPGVNAEKSAPITSFIDGPASFANFDDLLARTMEHNPTRSESSLRRGILHNAVQREDGSWVWRYARFRDGDSGRRPEFEDWWGAVAGLQMPLMLVRGLAWSVVGDEDVAELLRLQPTTTVVGVEGAGHSIQGDRPLELGRHRVRSSSPFQVADRGSAYVVLVPGGRVYRAIIVIVLTFVALCSASLPGRQRPQLGLVRWNGPFFAATPSVVAFHP